MGAAIDTSSAHTYGSALNSFIEFCRLHHFPIDPTAEILSFYVVFISNLISHIYVTFAAVCWSPAPFKDVNDCEVRLYVENIRYLEITFGAQSPPLPPSPSHDDLLFLSQLLTGFRALLRLGELTTPDNPKLRNPRKYTKRTSASAGTTSYEYWLPAHKADTLFEGNRVIVTDADALLHFHSYLKSRDQLHPLNPYLWLRANGHVPTRAWFIKRLRHLFPQR
ncbi:RNase H domain-containing protein [Mycena sanguinolenta]|uniref:RNase H domain-containing protein n=1 Tax=Mycena sanguinolenta TaxID=230812 RepID=A0A8H6XLK0_9AGAR|nr:RNase H domain-containing protein [Mycena sanguinolenta]